jgi:hypothetical protein
MFTQPLKKFSIKFQGQKPATSDPTTGAQTPATGPDHGLAEISLESHAPEKQGMGQGSLSQPTRFWWRKSTLSYGVSSLPPLDEG